MTDVTNKLSPADDSLSVADAGQVSDFQQLDPLVRLHVETAAKAVRKTVKQVCKVSGKSAVEALEIVLSNVLAMTLEFGERLKALEVRPDLRYRGTWDKSTTYAENSLITFQGSLWISKIESTGLAPGVENSCWQLCAKRGRDGKDAAR